MSVDIHAGPHAGSREWAGCPFSPQNIPLPSAHSERATRRLGAPQPGRWDLLCGLGLTAVTPEGWGLESEREGEREREKLGSNSLSPPGHAALGALGCSRPGPAPPRPRAARPPPGAPRVSGAGRAPGARGSRAGLGWSRSAPQTLGDRTRAREPCGAGWGRRGCAPRVPKRAWSPARGPPRRLCPRPGPRSLAAPPLPGRDSPPRQRSRSPRSSLRAWGSGTGDPLRGVKFISLASFQRSRSTEVSSACAEGPRSPRGLAMDLWGPSSGRLCHSGL